MAPGGGAPQPPLQNLQVLPKDMARAQVVQAMQAFTAALGVTCTHCHVFNGAGDPMNDFASDTKPTKNMARAMMRMVREHQSVGAEGRASKATDQVARGRLRDVPSRRAIPVVAPGTPGAPPPPRGAGPGAAARYGTAGSGVTVSDRKLHGVRVSNARSVRLVGLG